MFTSHQISSSRWSNKCDGVSCVVIAIIVHMARQNTDKSWNLFSRFGLLPAAAHGIGIASRYLIPEQLMRMRCDGGATRCSTLPRRQMESFKLQHAAKTLSVVMYCTCIPRYVRCMYL